MQSVVLMGPMLYETVVGCSFPLNGFRHETKDRETRFHPLPSSELLASSYHRTGPSQIWVPFLFFCFPFLMHATSSCRPAHERGPFSSLGHYLTSKDPATSPNGITRLCLKDPKCYRYIPATSSVACFVEWRKPLIK